jgi:hypoxanthine phosphoribosyltransferase
MTYTINFSWDTIHTAVECLEHLVKPLRPHLIVAVARGGLIPATLLSHRLNVHLETISASAYEGTRRQLQKPIVIEGWKEEYNQNDVLVVDDILDSGKTLGAISMMASGHPTSWRFNYVSLVNKMCSRYPGHKNFFAQVPQDVWVNFPWEQTNDSCIVNHTA